MPFRVAGDDLLRKIASLGRRASYEPGAIIYEIGDEADDLYIIVSGKAEHTLEPSVRARRARRC
jgi:CRP-like cAMP-binding protein